jgi:hypothetical protein
MPSDNGRRSKVTKVNGDSRAQMGEAPGVFSAEQALGGKRSAIEAIQLAEDRVEALQSPADSQQVRV